LFSDLSSYQVVIFRRCHYTVNFWKTANLRVESSFSSGLSFSLSFSSGLWLSISTWVTFTPQPDFELLNPQLFLSKVWNWTPVNGEVWDFGELAGVFCWGEEEWNTLGGYWLGYIWLWEKSSSSQVELGILTLPLALFTWLVDGGGKVMIRPLASVWMNLHLFP